MSNWYEGMEFSFKLVRETLGLNKSQAAARAGVRYLDWHRWESGEYKCRACKFFSDYGGNKRLVSIRQALERMKLEAEKKLKPEQKKKSFAERKAARSRKRGKAVVN